jgi:putative selenate reductase molybdopterin-binding subunit
MQLSFWLNGDRCTFDIDPGERLIDILREAGLTSVREGCDRDGSCGACTILLDGKAVNSCLVRAAQVQGRTVQTVEHFSNHRELSVIQGAFLDAGIVQCGYCTPAMIVAVEELLQRVVEPTRDDIKDALSGVFCRCTGYEQVFEAVRIACRRRTDPDYEPLSVPEFRDDLRVVGSFRRKVDGPHLVRGGPAFVDDRVGPNACHLKMLRSPHAHAYIKSIDTSAAEALDGVVIVVTHKNGPDVYYTQAGQGFPEPSPYDRKMFGAKVRHVGDRVAAVVAETEDIAKKALA